MIYAEFNQEINDLSTENLYQWDTYQMLKITGIDFGSVAPRVHFANKKSTEALVVNAILQSDGSVEVSIPNTLLAEKYDIIAYIYINTGLTSKTIKSITIPIIARLKPSEYYQPTNEEIAEIEAIELEAKAIIENLTASAYSDTETYKRPNIVYYGCDSYMCKSATEITGINPTDTTKWQRLTDIAEAIRNDAEELEYLSSEAEVMDLVTKNDLINGVVEPNHALLIKQYSAKPDVVLNNSSYVNVIPFAGYGMGFMSLYDSNTLSTTTVALLMIPAENTVQSTLGTNRVVIDYKLDAENAQLQMKINMDSETDNVKVTYIRMFKGF